MVVEDLNVGGAQRSVIALSRCFVEAGHKVEVWIFDEADRYRGVLDSRVRLLSLHDPRKRGSKLWTPLLLRQQLKSRRAENLTVLCFLPHMAFYLRWASLGFSWRVVACERMNPAFEFTHRAVGLRWAMAFTYPLFDAITVQTKQAKAYFSHLVSERVYVIENLLYPLPKYSSFSVEAFKPYVLFVGRMTQQKRVERVLREFDHAKKRISTPLHLVLVGDGPTKNQLVELSQSLKSRESIYFLGEQETSQELYGSAELLLLTSDYEGFPNVIVEALSNGCPVATTNCPSGPSELVRSEFNGCLIEDREGVGMADFIIRLTTSSSLRSQFRSNALKSSERFQWPVIYSQWAKFFSQDSGDSL